MTAAQMVRERSRQQREIHALASVQILACRCIGHMNGEPGRLRPAALLQMTMYQYVG
jgi:hypothetical protein